MNKQEQIDQARAALAFASAKYTELKQAAEFLRIELPKAQQAFHAAREKLLRLEASGAVKQGRVDELAWYEQRLAELKEGA